jgi:hypothetical protein
MMQIQNARASSRLRLTKSRSQKADSGLESASKACVTDPYASASATMYGKISRVAYNIAQQAAARTDSSKIPAQHEADDCNWDTTSKDARLSAASSAQSGAHDEVWFHAARCV